MKAAELTKEVVAVMSDVLVHQRLRWGYLLGHQRQYEGWWKAEMAAALESWSWRADLQDSPVWVRAEMKPAKFGVRGGPPSSDLVVARVNETFTDFDYTTRPRVWIELKERGTWWGNAAKALGTANNGLYSDLEKWSKVTDAGEVVLICQITSHDGSYRERLPTDWSDQLDEIAKKHERAMTPRSVGFELPGSDCIRWARLDAFLLNQ